MLSYITILPARYQKAQHLLRAIHSLASSSLSKYDTPCSPCRVLYKAIVWLIRCQHHYQDQYRHTPWNYGHPVGRMSWRKYRYSGAQQSVHKQKLTAWALELMGNTTDSKLGEHKSSGSGRGHRTWIRYLWIIDNLVKPLGTFPDRNGFWKIRPVRRVFNRQRQGNSVGAQQRKRWCAEPTGKQARRSLSERRPIPAKEEQGKLKYAVTTTAEIGLQVWECRRGFSARTRNRTWNEMPKEKGLNLCCDGPARVRIRNLKVQGGGIHRREGNNVFSILCKVSRAAGGNGVDTSCCSQPTVLAEIGPHCADDEGDNSDTSDPIRTNLCRNMGWEKPDRGKQAKRNAPQGNNVVSRAKKHQGLVWGERPDARGALQIAPRYSAMVSKKVTKEKLTPGTVITFLCLCVKNWWNAQRLNGAEVN